MPLHPEAYTPSQQVVQMLTQLTERVRRLEGRRVPVPLAVTNATPASTTSTTAVPLFRFTGPAPDTWQITIAVAVTLTVNDSHAGLELRDPSGRGLASTVVRDGNVATLTCQDALMPLTLYGYASAGTLSVTINAAEAAPWSGPTD